ncbi:MAG: hypothetical protein AAF533_20045 [Acidobacteriota bacterium]
MTLQGLGVLYSGRSFNNAGTASLQHASLGSRYSLLRQGDLAELGLLRSIASSKVYAGHGTDTALFFFHPLQAGSVTADFEGSFLHQHARVGRPLEVDDLREHAFEGDTTSALLVRLDENALYTKASEVLGPIARQAMSLLLKAAKATGARPSIRRGPTFSTRLFPEGDAAIDADEAALRVSWELALALPWPLRDHGIWLTLDLVPGVDDGRPTLDPARIRWSVDPGPKRDEVSAHVAELVDANAEALAAQVDAMAGVLDPGGVTLTDLYVIPGARSARPSTGVSAGFTALDATLVAEY